MKIEALKITCSHCGYRFTELVSEAQIMRAHQWKIACNNCNAVDGFQAVRTGLEILVTGSKGLYRADMFEPIEISVMGSSKAEVVRKLWQQFLSDESLEQAKVERKQKLEKIYEQP